MKRSGAWLVRYALEQLPVSFTFGIPGVHVTEIYDELGKSEKVRPILVTHEAGAAFMADAISRTAQGQIGTLLVVPAAGITHAMSGIGEAFLDGIPLLVLSGGARSDIPYGFQLHQLDQGKLVAGVTKGAWRVTSHAEIVPTIFEAYRVATSGFPGPVLVEIPANIQLFQGEIGEVPVFEKASLPPSDSEEQIRQAVDLLVSAQSPGIFVGWGAVDAQAEVREIAEWLGAPVSTTLQGLSAFPASHPLHTGMGFGPASVPAARENFLNCDCLLAVGTRFGEIPTGSYSCRVPDNLVHVDIDPAAIDRNFKAKVPIVGDAKSVLREVLAQLGKRESSYLERRNRIEEKIQRLKLEEKKAWLDHRTERVSPAVFFQELRKRLPQDGIVVVDDGNHTFLAAELLEVESPRTFISPTDFNCMGYAVPAAIGAKLSHPERSVVAIVGDGAFLMTGLEILTAATENLGIPYFVFHDGELSQISQGQQIPYNRKTCTILGDVRLEGIALATGAKYLAMDNSAQAASVIEEAFQAARKGQPVVVDVRIDYSKKTRFTQGVVQSVFKRFPLGEKVRFVGRSIMRKTLG